MKKWSLVIGAVVLITIGILLKNYIENSIDVASGEIIEQTLSDNTISQLNLLHELETLINSGNVSEAKKKITEAKKTYLYILKTNCSLPKCDKAVSNKEKL